MGAISSGVGLISGLNIQDIVSKLMLIEKQPLTLLQNRLQETEAERTAYADLSARVLAIKSALAPLRTNPFFQKTTATSSDPNILQATTSTAAVAGTYQLRVQQLATAQQLVSRGVSDPARSALGEGTFVVASAMARLRQPTSLDFLNGQQGVTRGTIRITDRSGATAQVDLSAARTVDDVLQAINDASGVQVRAEVQGDRLVILDESGQQTTALAVSDLAGGRTAADLGIVGSSTTGRIDGTDVNTIDEQTVLSLLNDGNGVSIHGTQADVRITAANGTSFTVNLSNLITADTNLAVLNGGLGVRLGTVKVTTSDGNAHQVDLSSARTMDDVIKAFKTSANVTVSITGNKLSVVDGNAGDKKLIIEDVTGQAAADLGIVGASAGSDSKDAESITGEEIYHVRTIGDVLRAINYAKGNDGTVTATFESMAKGILLSDHTAGANPLKVESLNGSSAAADLGLAGESSGGMVVGRRLVATINSTLLRSLNGGAGVRELGQVRITDRAGNESIYDFTGAQTVEEVLAILNSQPGAAKVQAELTDTGLGFVLRDTSDGTGNLTIEDVTGTTAADLRIAGTSGEEAFRGGALYRQYVNGNTTLSSLNGGKGIAAGSFRITDSKGNVETISLTGTASLRLQDVINKINASGDKLLVEARINDSGDGIVIIDKAGGANALKIEENGSTTATDLHIAGTAETGSDRLDGRSSLEIDLDAGDSLNDLVKHLNKAPHLLQAGVINDGSSVSPYRLVVTAANTGARGALAIDAAGTALSFDTLVAAQDAVVYFGGDGVTGGVPVVSSDNQLESLIPGLTLTLTGTSEKATSITVARDTDGLVTQMSTFIEKYNDVFGRLADLTSYNQETEERGILLGDSTAEQLRTTLQRMISTRAGTDTQFKSLSDLGISIGSGSQLEFDEEEFRAAIAADPDAVRELFTDTKNGLWTKLDSLLASLTDKGSGILSTRDQSLQDRADMFSDRIEDMSVLLSNKEQRLYAQYQAMEAALAKLQSQQSALASIASMASSMKQSTAGG